MCNRLGHTALTCIYLFNQAYTSVASTSAHYTNYNPNTSWYPDTAAKNHVMSDLTNLNLHAADYTGVEQLQVGDGSSVPISHFGLALFPSPSSKVLLNKLLCVPFFTKNLISIRQFCYDNNVFFQFFSNRFYVKDCNTRTLLLQGTTAPNGLYTFSPQPPQAYSSSPSSLSQWHALLVTHLSRLSSLFLLNMVFHLMNFQL